MVYCGKPSKSCAPCRVKRTKCDLKHPVCSQCRRTGRVCTGYRDITVTEFHDHSQGASAKVRNASAPIEGIPASSKSEITLFDPHPKQVSNSGTEAPICKTFETSILQSYSPYLQENAASFFFNDYLLEDSPTPRYVYDCLPRLYRASPPNSALANVVTALGLACLAKALHAPDIMMKGNIKYADSLKAINSALRDPIEARADETLLVVILLGLYEEHNIATKPIEPWTNHMKGALALLEYRGAEQLGNPIGLQLIRSLRTQVVVNCLVRRVDVPETILKWSRLAREHENDHEVAESELADIMAKFCNLQAAIDCVEYDNDPSVFVSCALSIEAELAQWSSKWHSLFLYGTIMAEGTTPEVFEDYWHLYPDILVALIWNHFRCIRVLVNRIIITQLEAMTQNLDADLVSQCSSIYNNQIDSSRKIIVGLSHELCASIPYFLAHYPHDQSDNWYSSTTYAGPEARAKLVMWPLYVIAQAEAVSDTMRNWVIGQLDELSVQLGTHNMKAKALASLLRNRQQALGKAWRELGMDDS